MSRREAMKLARDRAERGIVSSILHAERSSPGWSERAYSYVCAYAVMHRVEAFTMEDLRLAAFDSGLDPPPDLRAFGGVTQRAIRRGVLKPTGRYRATVSSSGGAKPLYIGGV